MDLTLLINKSSNSVMACPDCAITPIQFALFVVVSILLLQMTVLAWKCHKYRGLIPPEQRPPSIIDLLKSLKEK
jgi:hypothetical protein